MLIACVRACVRVPEEDMCVFVVLSHGQQLVTGRTEGEGEDATLVATIHSRQLAAIRRIPHAHGAFAFASFGSTLASSNVPSTRTDYQTHNIVIVSCEVLLGRKDLCKGEMEEEAHVTEKKSKDI